MTLDIARDIVRDVSYFANDDGSTRVCRRTAPGATHSTAHTITPAFEIIKTTDESAKVSSVFFMCLSDRV